MAFRTSGAALVLLTVVPLLASADAVSLERLPLPPSSIEAPPVDEAAPPWPQTAQEHPLWSQGLALESQDRFLESADLYERIAADLPADSYVRWRLARNHWRHGESLPFEAKDDRMASFTTAREWAHEGLEVDPECAACMLWKASSIGRQATTRGIVSAASSAKELAELFEAGIKVQPQHADHEGNTTLGNLYYASAVFYRVVPDWWWLKWVIGTRGDKDKSLRYIRKAVDISGSRVDYQVELGAVLTCIGTTRDEKERLDEGARELRRAMGMRHLFANDAIDASHAGIILEKPELACGYSRDGFIDIAGAKVDMQREHFGREPRSWQAVSAPPPPDGQTEGAQPAVDTRDGR